MSKVVLTGDWHLHNYSQFARPWRDGLNTRAKHIFDVVGKFIPNWMSSHDIERFVHLGDWHVNDSNDYRLVNLALLAAEQCGQKRIVHAIAGNHDTVVNDPGSFNALPYYPAHAWLDNVGMDGWVVKKVGYNTPLPTPADVKNKRVVVLMHKDIMGGRTSTGFVYRSVSAIRLIELLKLKEAAEDIVFFGGHYHEQQTISKLVKIVGAPVQHNRGDALSVRGFCVWDTQTKNVEFVPCPGPQFVTGSLAEISSLGELDDLAYVTIEVEAGDMAARRNALQYIGDNKLTGVVRDLVETSTSAHIANVKLESTSEAELLDKWLLKNAPNLSVQERADLVKLSEKL